MFDEKYLNTGNVKKIETVEQAKAILAITKICKGCEECPVRMYEPRKGSSCSEVQKSATNFLKKAGVPVPVVNAKGILADVYNRIACPTMEESKEATAISNRSCAGCMNAELHSSGIYWCKSFGNFVHADGYCYRFVTSAKMEETDG